MQRRRFFMKPQFFFIGLIVVVNGVEGFVVQQPPVPRSRSTPLLYLARPPHGPNKSRQSTPCRRASSSSSTEPPTSSVTASMRLASDWQYIYWPLAQFVLHSFVLALLLISWEDVTCQWALPSRQQQQLVATTTTTPWTSIAPRRTMSWGQSTVRGLGFGQSERLALDQSDDAANVPSYNEILLQHRLQRVPSWHAIASPQEQAQAIHTLLECYYSIQQLRHDASEYQWTTLRQTLAASPWTELAFASSTLRSVDPAVGFDWASCAWRHCGALADAQEALDELDALTGVLEPFEAIFCLDIMERSVRDMLAEAPWGVVTTSTDYEAWKNVPPYQPHRVFAAPNDPDNPLESQEAEESWRLDEEYLKALQELRVEDD